ncbi:MAG: IPT/TIG domain-containing protein, partial [Candidatus Omnitrophica bacterium]|nr:IPT/TIG domain-containing protein [Candidatus Omnitrophota bacterium]
MNRKILITTCVGYGILFLCCLNSLAYAASPVIFYSDLISGPRTGGKDNKGVFVTISGKNFGSSRGTSYVSVGGGQVDNYPIWTDTKVTFQLGANVVTGNIVLTTSEGTSNGILFTVRSGNIYFADNINGNDSTGDGSINNPWKSLNPKLVNEASDGDTFYLRQGVWTEKLYVGANSGTSGNEIAIVGYPGETAAIIKS